VRSALGASRGQLLRVILSESMLFAIAGGAAGLALAYGAMQVLLLLAPEGTAAGLQSSLDVPVLLFCGGIVIFSGALFGILPAWRISRSNPNAALKGARASTSDQTRQRLRSLLVVVETALALMLLVSAGLFLRSFLRLEDVDPGFNPHGVMTASFGLPRLARPDVEKRAAFFRAVVESLRRRPGVKAVAIGYPIPFSGITNAGGFTIEGRPPVPGDPGPHGDVRYVTPDYFEALSIVIKRGRVFTDGDRSTTQPVVVIDDTVARRYLPDEDPLGKRLIRAGVTSTIIGVVGHVMHDDLADPGRGAIYFTAFQQALPAGAVVVKTSGDTSALAPAIRAAVREVDPGQAVFAVRPMEELVAKSLAPRRFAVRLLGFFGAVALFLAALGLYGVISYSVAQRTREIGIRVALGAGRRTVIGQVVGQGIRMAGAGVGIGIAGAVLCGRLLSSELFGVTAFDPVTLIAMASALLGSAAIASYLPALRAARVDPVTALRDE
jgi:putative ABC transport system permease protein